jgi:hypothetical protein
VGAIAILVGCDTQGAANMAGSVASSLMSLGARAVYSTYFPVTISLGTQVLSTMVWAAMHANDQFGDVMGLTRVSALARYCAGLVGVAAGRKLKRDAYLRFDGYYEKANGWDQQYREFLSAVEQQLETLQPCPFQSAQLIDSAALAGLAMSFAGDLRGRAFEF